MTEKRGRGRPKNPPGVPNHNPKFEIRLRPEVEAWDTQMKALSVKQPWANLIAEGRKTLEIRSWRTNLRGEILIVSSRKGGRGIEGPFGVTLCRVDIVDVRRFTPSDEPLAHLDWSPGLWAWVLRNPVRIEQRPVLGKLGIFEVEPP